MPIWLNLVLGTLLQVAVFFGPLVLYVCINKGHIINVLFFYILAIFCMIDVVTVRFIFRKLVPAKCPKCGGKTYCKGSRPIYYKCSDCNHIHETTVSEGAEYKTGDRWDMMDG